MKTTLILPTLNELGGMKEIMPKIKKEWFDQIIVVDGGSTDGTIEYARDNGYSIYIQKGKGLRQGLREMWGMVEGDIVVTFSPDGNSIPELIPPLIEKMKGGYDMVIVSRYAKGARSYDDDWLTRFGNWMFTTMINVLFRARYDDALVIFRAYKTDLIDRLDINNEAKFLTAAERAGILIGWEPQLSIRCAKRKLKVAEIPGDEPARIYGKRKMRPFQSGSVMLAQILYEIFVWR
ncbi:MAG: glycosyltransferase family 2 protein [Candidatus Omnitrophota bacterium]